MSEIPPPSYNAPPAAAAPAQRKFPTWAIVVIVLVVLCLCIGCIVAIVVGQPMFNGAMAGGELPFVCIEQSGLDTNACSTWAQGVTSTPEFSTCVNDLLTAGNLTGDSLYQCLVDAGVGP